MKIYIASSWKNVHAVEMLTDLLRGNGHAVESFVENQHGDREGHTAMEHGTPMQFDEWIRTRRAAKCFVYDTNRATTSDLVIYVGPSGCDAWAEIGAAWSKEVIIFGLIAKGDQIGLMRKMVSCWFHDHREMMGQIEDLQLRFDRDRDRDRDKVTEEVT